MDRHCLISCSKFPGAQSREVDQDQPDANLQPAQLEAATKAKTVSVPTEKGRTSKETKFVCAITQDVSAKAGKLPCAKKRGKSFFSFDAMSWHGKATKGTNVPLNASSPNGECSDGEGKRRAA